MNNSSKEFIGTGWKFPIEFDEDTMSPAMLSGEENIVNSLNVLFATIVGERTMHPDYGSALGDFIFMPLSTGMITYMEAVISNAILFNEPRIILDNVVVKPRPEDLGYLEITVEYIISATNNRYNYVYPFYLKEATNLLK